MPKATRDEVLARIQKVICPILKIDPAQVKPQSRFLEDFLVDSMTMVQIVGALEKEFHFEIFDGINERFQSIDATIDYILDNDLA